MTGSSTRLLDRLGGPDALSQVVQAFYFYVFRDEEVGPFFAGVDSHRVMQHQEQLLCLLLADKPPAVSDYLSRSHAHLVRERGLTHRHFDVVCWLLVRTLRDFKLDTLSIVEISTRLEGLRAAVLAGNSGSSGVGSNPLSFSEADSACAGDNRRAPDRSGPLDMTEE